MRNDWWSSPWAMAFGRGRFFGSGEVRLAILSLLGESPKHGYQLMKELEERSGGLYRASAGSVYPTLQQLEDEELISSSQPDGKRVYSITGAGIGELAKDPEAISRIWRRAEKWGEWGQMMSPDAFHFMKPLMSLNRAAWQAANRVSGKAEAEDKLRETLDRITKELEQL
jgi:DNA-binding PadR family transcriptional regulator